MSSSFNKGVLYLMRKDIKCRNELFPLLLLMYQEFSISEGRLMPETFYQRKISYKALQRKTFF